MTSAYAPYVQTIGNFAPYLTFNEYNNAPTAIDTGNLLPGGSAAAQVMALQEVIYRASSWIDGYVTGNAYGTLNATSNVENARVWGSGGNRLIIHPLYWPILEVQSFQFSTLPGNSAGAVSVTPAGNIWIEPQQFIVSPGGLIGLGLTGLGVWGGIGLAQGYQYYCQWQYVNGFPNTTLTASVSSGATSVTVASGLGIYPNSQLTLFDLPYDEQVQVSSSYTPDTTTLTFSSPLQYSHPVGAVLTNLPKAVKQAAILLTSALIKQRGSGALMVEDMGMVTKVDDGLPQGADADIALAAELLLPFRQQATGY